MIGVTIIAAKEGKHRPAALPWNRRAGACGWGRGVEANGKGLARGLIVLATLLLVVGSSYVGLAQLPNPSTEVIAQIDGQERGQIRSIEIVDCRDSVLAGQDSRLAASDSVAGRAELARHLDEVAQYCGCAFEAGSHLLTKDDIIKHWTAAGRAYQEGALTGNKKALLDESVRMCAEEAGLPTDVAYGTP